MYRLYLVFLVSICILLLACNSTSRLLPEQQKRNKNEVSWQCSEFRDFFYSRGFSSEVMSSIEEIYSNHTCEEFKEFNAKLQERVKIIMKEFGAEEKTGKYQFKSEDKNIVHCYRNIYGFLYCDDPMFGRKTYPPTYLREN